MALMFESLRQTNFYLPKSSDNIFPSTFALLCKEKKEKKGLPLHIPQTDKGVLLNTNKQYKTTTLCRYVYSSCGISYKYLTLVSSNESTVLSNVYYNIIVLMLYTNKCQFRNIFTYLATKLEYLGIEQKWFLSCDDLCFEQ